MCIYIFIVFMYTIYVYMFIYDMYIYIYIYVHSIYSILGKGQMGSALMGSLQTSCFLTEGLFGYSR